MMESGRSGIYFRVIRAGRVAAGDEIVRVHRQPREVSVRELSDLLVRRDATQARLREMLEVDRLTDGWRRRVQALIAHP
jgi:MOSC domain-containing protein YiiM